MTTHPAIPCPVPGCTEEVEYEPPYPADRATNVAAWRGGYLCPVHDEVEIEDPELFCEFTGPMP